MDVSSVYNSSGVALKLVEIQALLCSICGFILKEAMQVTQCGHRFCRFCIEKLLSERYKFSYCLEKRKI